MDIIEKMYLYGASGHGKVIKEILDAQGIVVDGFIDDNTDISDLSGFPVVHSANDIRDIIVNRDSEEYDPVHHEAAENVHRRNVQLPFLDDRRVDVGIERPLIPVEGQGTESPFPGGVFLELLVHITSIRGTSPR